MGQNMKLLPSILYHADGQLSQCHALGEVPPRRAGAPPGLEELCSPPTTPARMCVLRPFSRGLCLLLPHHHTQPSPQAHCRVFVGSPPLHPCSLGVTCLSHLRSQPRASRSRNLITICWLSQQQSWEVHRTLSTDAMLPGPAP